ncbi:hydrogenase iron-sulfur subunit, partial [Chloroflexota bacterium]
HYIDANRSTVRRMDGLWDGLEKAGLRPDRLQLEWCSAAEGPRWQTIMTEVEKKRQNVLATEVEKTREVLLKARVPSPRNPRPGNLGQPAEFACMRCGSQWADLFQIEERTCPQCRSNSVRWLRAKK